MNEELNRQEAELNDAALSGVSGGDNHNPTVQESAHANAICGICPRRTGRGVKCGHKMAELAQYIHEHGDILSFQECPYFKS